MATTDPTVGTPTAAMTLASAEAELATAVMDSAVSNCAMPLTT